MLDNPQITTYARLLRLMPVDGFAPPQPDAQAPSSAPVTRPKRQGLISLLCLVGLPTCLAIGYFGFWAADRYESEARFILRTTSQKAMPEGVASDIMQRVGNSRTNDDGYIVQEFLESRDAVALLEKTADLRQAFSVGRRDPLWSYPRLLGPDSEEHLFDYYQRMMSATFDSATGISVLKIQAFTSQDARRLAGALLGAAETLVNRLNERARLDAVTTAEAEAVRMRQRMLEAQDMLTSFREREKLIDPQHAVMGVLQTIARLSVDAAELNVQLAELTKSASSAPHLSALRNRRTAIEDQIIIERQRLAGATQSIAPRIVEYERLVLEREFAVRALTAAMTAVEAAKVDARRQQIYLERVVEPSIPDYPAYPWRITWILATLIAGYMTYRIWRILAADTRRHSDP